MPEGRRIGRESSRSDQRISEAIVRYDYGCFGTLGSQSARTLVARAERTRSSAGRTSWCQEGWSLGPREPGRAPTLPLPESLSAGLPLCPFPAGLLVPRVMRVWQGIVRACAPLPGDVG